MSLLPPTPDPTPELGVDDLDVLLCSDAVSVAGGTDAWIRSGRTVTLGAADAA